MNTRKVLLAKLFDLEDKLKNVMTQLDMVENKVDKVLNLVKTVKVDAKPETKVKPKALPKSKK